MTSCASGFGNFIDSYEIPECEVHYAGLLKIWHRSLAGIFMACPRNSICAISWFDPFVPQIPCFE